VLGAAAGGANGDTVVRPDDDPPVVDDPVESGPTDEGTNSVPAGTLLCASAREFGASSTNPKQSSAIVRIAKRGTRRAGSFTCIFTD
jgi:hypothetical protein